MFLQEIKSKLLNTSKQEKISVENTEEQSETHVVIYNEQTNETMSVEEYTLRKDKNGSLDATNNAVANSSMNAVLFNAYVYSDIISKTVSHKVVITAFIGQTPTKVKVTSRLRSATSRSNPFSTEATTTTDLKLVNSSTEATTVASTRFFNGNFSADIYSGSAIVSVYNGDTPYARLYNKNAMVYPPYTDPHSGIVMTEPITTTWARVTPISWSGRNAYITWYESQYGVPSWNWADYQIHHIRPRNLGGSNVNSNLIPLPTTFHTGTVNPWFAAY